MGLEQFSKVVLLPQGEFAAFLRASPEARREVLERLFDISSFAGIEDWLACERRRTAELVAERRSAVTTGLATLADPLADAPVGLLDDAADWEAMEPHQVPAELERLHGALEGFAVQTLADLDAAATAAETAASRSQAAERIIDLQQKARTATRRLAELETAGALHSEARATLAQAARAAAVSGELRSLARAEVAQEAAALPRRPVQRRACSSMTWARRAAAASISSWLLSRSVQAAAPSALRSSRPKGAKAVPVR